MPRSPYPRKLLLLGPPRVGKTVLRCVFFEGENPTQLLLNPPPATRRQETRKYTWLDTEVVTVDCGSRNADRWHDEDVYDMFAMVDVVIYMLEPSSDRIKPVSEEVLRQFKRVLTSTSKYNAHSAQVFVFIHKTDLIPPDRVEEVTTSIRSLLEQVVDSQEPQSKLVVSRFYSTSIVDGSAFVALREIMNNFTPRGQRYQELCETVTTQYRCESHLDFHTPMAAHALVITQVMVVDQRMGYVVAYSSIPGSHPPDGAPPSFPTRLLAISALTVFTPSWASGLDSMADPAPFLFLLGKTYSYVLAPLKQDILLVIGLVSPRTGIPPISLDILRTTVERIRELAGDT